MKFQWSGDTMMEAIHFTDPAVDGHYDWDNWILATFSLCDWHVKGAVVDYIGEIRYLNAMGQRGVEFAKKEFPNARPILFDDEKMLAIADGWASPYDGVIGRFKNREFYEFMRDRYNRDEHGGGA